eukprot:gene32805-43848_t
MTLDHAGWTARAAGLRLSTGLLIDGKRVPAADGATIAVINPATGKTLAEVAGGGAADIDRAVASARAAWNDGRWRHMAPRARMAIFSRFADLVEANADELALLECLSMGKPITDALTIDVPETVVTLRYFGECIDKIAARARQIREDPVSQTIKADIVVIGAGSGGLSVAAGAAQLGLKVVLFEKGEMGGDCLNYGCVPSKALIAAASAAHEARHSGHLGVRAKAVSVDFAKVMAHARATIATIAPVDSQERFEGLGCQVIREAARFVDARTVASDSVRVEARKFVIATGSRAMIPPIPGLDVTPHLTNETIFELKTLPERLIVLGGGPIGVELGQAFRRLGSQVVILEAEAILGREDPEAAT